MSIVGGPGFAVQVMLEDLATNILSPDGQLGQIWETLLGHTVHPDMSDDADQLPVASVQNPVASVQNHVATVENPVASFQNPLPRLRRPEARVPWLDFSGAFPRSGRFMELDTGVPHSLPGSHWEWQDIILPDELFHSWGNACFPDGCRHAGKSYTQVCHEEPDFTAHVIGQVQWEDVGHLAQHGSSYRDPFGVEQFGVLTDGSIQWPVAIYVDFKSYAMVRSAAVTCQQALSDSALPLCRLAYTSLTT